MEFAETASTQPNSKTVHLHNSKAKLAVLPVNQAVEKVWSTSFL